MPSAARTSSNLKVVLLLCCNNTVGLGLLISIVVFTKNQYLKFSILSPVNICMLDINAKTGSIDNFLTHDEMIEYRQHFLSTNPAKSNLMDNIYGIDSKNISHYLWFKKTMWQKFAKILDTKVNLAVAMFCQFTDSFKIHNDNGKYLADKKHKSHLVFLIPFSVNKDIEQCYKSHTLVFTKEPNPNALQDHEKYLSNNPISRVEKYKILNGCLPPEDGSVRPQTLGKRVSDDPRHFIFRG